MSLTNVFGFSGIGSFLLWLLIGIASLGAQTDREVRLGYMEGQAVVGFNAEIAPAVQREILAELGLSIRLPYRGLDAWWVTFDRVRAVPEVLASIRRRTEIRFAHANALGHWAVNFPNDGGFGNCWGLHNSGQTIVPGGTIPADPGTADADMDLPEAWDLITDASAVVLAIADTGCLLSHPDLAPNLWINPGEIASNGIDDDGNGFVDDVNGWDFAYGDNQPEDTFGHGTLVTSCALARGNNGIGATGTAWVGRAMILKFGDYFPQVAALAAAMVYAAQNGASVVNVSAGFGPGPFPILQAAVTTLANADINLIVAAGNTPWDLGLFPDLPASYPNANIVVVAATDNDDQSAWFSTYGATAVHVAAPGTNIYVCLDTGGYGYADGTSFSAPLVAGGAALLRAFNPTLTAAQVRATLISTSDAKPQLATLSQSGGRVNLAAALQSVQPPQNPPTPNPMTFSVLPQALSETTATMAATLATGTPGPVEYRFLSVGVSGAGGAPWQSSPLFVATGLTPNTLYTYTVTARDASTLVAGSPSAPATFLTPAVAPVAPLIGLITQTSLEVVTVGPNGNAAATEFAIEVNGQYYDGNGGFSATPTFQTEAAWAASLITGLLPGTLYSIRTKARDLYGVETAFGPPFTVRTAWLSSAADGVVGAGVGGPYDVFLIDSQNGGFYRRLSLGVGQSLTLEILQPPTNQQPAQWVLLAWFGIPAPFWEFPLPFAFGTLVFPPCVAVPSAPSVIVASTYGPPPCGGYFQPTLAPFTLALAGFPFPLYDVTFQLVIEETPGQPRAGNALILNYQ